MNGRHIHNKRSGVALIYRKDIWTLEGAFSLWGVQCRTMGATMIDPERQRWLGFVNHFPNGPALQSVLLRRLQQYRMQFQELPCLMLSDHNSILVLAWDDSKAFASGRCAEESQHVIKAREVEWSSMLTMGLQDVWRKVYPDPEDTSEAGPTREHRRINRILVSPGIADLIQTVQTTPGGGADHLAVIAKVCPSVQFKPSNIWRLPPAPVRAPRVLAGHVRNFPCRRGHRGCGLVGNGAATGQKFGYCTGGAAVDEGDPTDAVADSSPQGLSPLATSVLQDMGKDFHLPEQGYNRLPGREKEQVQAADMHELLWQSLWGNVSAPGARRARAGHLFGPVPHR